MIRILNIILLFFILFTFSSPLKALGGNCSPCKDKFQELKNESEKEAYNKVLLKKNQDYLSSFGKINKSGAIKVKSNIFVISLRLETSKNNIEAIHTELTQKGCNQCPKT